MKLAALVALAVGLAGCAEFSPGSRAVLVGPPRPVDRFADFAGINFLTAAAQGFCLTSGTSATAAVAACDTVGDTGVQGFVARGYLLPHAIGNRVTTLRCRVLAVTGLGSGDSVAVQPYQRNGVSPSVVTAGVTIPDGATAGQEFGATIGAGLPLTGGSVALRLTATDANESITDLDLVCSLGLAH